MCPYNLQKAGTGKKKHISYEFVITILIKSSKQMSSNNLFSEKCLQNSSIGIRKNVK